MKRTKKILFWCCICGLIIIFREILIIPLLILAIWFEWIIFKRVIKLHNARKNELK